ncbi:MAG TPA: hypothetical protein ENH82_04280 [bacterium]|nr:hypothetical protein [bacterium]
MKPKYRILKHTYNGEGVGYIAQRRDLGFIWCDLPLEDFQDTTLAQAKELIKEDYNNSLKSTEIINIET